MTENKRFLLKENGVIDDTQLNILLDGGEDKEDMVDLLNDLHEENKNLKDFAQHNYSETKKIINTLQKENEQLKQENRRAVVGVLIVFWICIIGLIVKGV